MISNLLDMIDRSVMDFASLYDVSIIIDRILHCTYIFRNSKQRQVFGDTSDVESFFMIGYWFIVT